MGLTNTLSGLLVLVPLVGGWILEHTSYPLLFSLAAVGTLAGALLALGLARAATRRGEPAAVEVWRLADGLPGKQ